MAEKEYIERDYIDNILDDYIIDHPLCIDRDAARTVKEKLASIPAADVVEEENILKFYYVHSIDEYWIGRRVDNFYYADYDPKIRQWVWTHSRYLPWGEHVVSPTSLWKEHTYPSEPEEIPFEEWLQGFIKKHAADVVGRKPLPEDVSELVKDLYSYSKNCTDIETCQDCPLFDICEDGWPPNAIAHLIETWSATHKAMAKQKTGKWIPITVSSGRDSWQCSVCGRRARGKVENLPYCHCGAKMIGGDDDV